MDREIIVQDDNAVFPVIDAACNNEYYDTDSD